MRRKVQARTRHVEPHEHGSGYDHAWIELPDGRVYDAVLDEYFTRAAYCGKFAAVAVRVYTPQQAMKAMLAAKHCGPWP
jgi:hypothetical protein